MANRHSDWDIACKVYVGGLSRDATKYDLEDAFSKYGSVRNIWVARQPPGFAFVEMEDSRDAEDAARGLDGTRLAGRRVKVEMSTGKSRDRGNRDRGDRDRDRGRGQGTSRRDRDRSRSRSRSRGRSRRSPSYRSMSREKSREKSSGRRKRSRSTS